jgi:hypothetical protein
MRERKQATSDFSPVAYFSVGDGGLGEPYISDSAEGMKRKVSPVWRGDRPSNITAIEQYPCLPCKSTYMNWLPLTAA